MKKKYVIDDNDREHAPAGKSDGGQFVGEGGGSGTAKEKPWKTPVGTGAGPQFPEWEHRKKEYLKGVVDEELINFINSIQIKSTDELDDARYVINKYIKDRAKNGNQIKTKKSVELKKALESKPPSTGNSKVDMVNAFKNSKVNKGNRAAVIEKALDQFSDEIVDDLSVHLSGYRTMSRKGSYAGGALSNGNGDDGYQVTQIIINEHCFKEDTEDQDFRMVWVHEIGHLIDNEKNTGKRKYTDTQEWKRIWKEEIGWKVDSDGATVGSSPLTDYAAKNKTEGFAEFIVAVVNGQVGWEHKKFDKTKFPKAIQFLKDNKIIKETK